jgi:hypothetical protein
MFKKMKWIVLVAALFWLGGCTRTSEAKVNVTNTGAVQISVTISDNTTMLAPGANDTITLTWPGRILLDATMVYYPVGQFARAEYIFLELNHGDALDFHVGFPN